MLGFHVGFWDYITFLAILFIVLGFLGVVVFILGLPGRIAIARNHPEADAVNLMGWVGFLAIVPWIQALIWAFKPTDVVDIRRFPEAEQRATEALIRQMSGKESPAETPQQNKPAG